MSFFLVQPTWVVIPALFIRHATPVTSLWYVIFFTIEAPPSRYSRTATIGSHPCQYVFIGLVNFIYSV
jgi:hypothetical protein